ncbi:MAG: DUF5666 domain-containing protein [Chloroflexota bacterium]|nr:DUF5666 domain-containing protein [Chloroflexota bacterium]
MSEMDDILHKKLQSMQDGATLDENQGNLEAEELSPLIKIASQIHNMSHPSPSSKTVQETEGRVLAAARDQSNRQNQAQKNSKRLNWVWVPAVVGAALIVLCFAAVLVSGGVWLAGPRDSKAATLSELVGIVEVIGADGNWQPVAEGDRLHSGDQLRTLQDSKASLEFFNGSHTTLSPNTEIILTDLDGGWGNVLQVKLAQLRGSTNHDIVRLKGKNGHFIVVTPSGSASVKGTTFNVSVNVDGNSLFSVERGTVLVEGSGNEVDLAAGQATTTRHGQAPEQPAYVIVLDDVLSAIEGDIWMVSGVPFQISEDTYMTVEANPGDTVQVAGRILDNKYVADLVQLSDSNQLEDYFTGIINHIDDEAWVINGITVLVNEATEFEGEFQVGDAVKIKYIVLEGGRWLALEIEHLDDDDDQTPTTTSTLDGSLMPPVTGSETPEPTRVDCTGADPHPTGKKLAQRYGVAYEELMNWFCQNFGFGEIDLAYTLSRATGIPTADIFALRRSGMGWGEIKRYVYQMPTPTATPTITPTVTLTPTVTVTGTITVTPTPPIDAYCTGNAENHPTGKRLALRYQVSYDEIMGWFCQGFGFGEIVLAYDLSNQTGEPVAKIFALRQAGYGWGQIKAQMVDKHAKPTKKPKKTKTP